MTTLSVRATGQPLMAGFGRVKTFLIMLFEVIADAQRQAAAAHKRYPFSEW